MRSSIKLVASGAIGLIAILACGRVTAPRSEPTPSVSSANPVVTQPSTKILASCSNPQQGYSISYPDGWFTTQNNPQNACRWFDRELFKVVDASEAPLTALSVSVSDETFDAASGRMKKPYARRVLQHEVTAISGYRALRFEVEQTEEVVHPKGTRTYGYYIELGPKVIIVETNALPDSKTPYEDNKKVVDESVTTLQSAKA